ncbi:hypothetical protein DU504_11305 [Haloplanus salinus]|uniref:Uncharacterized protein n=1 Tax=Haloplanus salinus TaxID=1126245 RepID=A0A368NCH8_9EURY|nr:hypothetical protein DU504_11305 [Haloplanus salinus]
MQSVGIPVTVLITSRRTSPARFVARIRSVTLPGSVVSATRNNVTNASANKAGDNASDDAPAGLDVQFFAATDGVFSAGSAGSKNQGDVALIDRAVAPAATDFQDPKDPSTIQLNLQEDTPNGGDIDYLRVSDGDTGYARLTPGESIDVLVRAIVVDRYLSTNDVGTQLNGGFTIRAMNNEVGMIRTDEVALDTKPISEP